jgi:hypothetical protein
MMSSAYQGAFHGELGHLSSTGNDDFFGMTKILQCQFFQVAEAIKQDSLLLVTSMKLVTGYMQLSKPSHLGKFRKLWGAMPQHLMVKAASQRPTAHATCRATSSIHILENLVSQRRYLEKQEPIPGSRGRIRGR